MQYSGADLESFERWGQGCNLLGHYAEQSKPGVAMK